MPEKQVERQEIECHQLCVIQNTSALFILKARGRSGMFFNRAWILQVLI